MPERHSPQRLAVRRAQALHLGYIRTRPQDRCLIKDESHDNDWAAYLTVDLCLENEFTGTDDSEILQGNMQHDVGSYVQTSRYLPQPPSGPPPCIPSCGAAGEHHHLVEWNKCLLAELQCW